MDRFDGFSISLYKDEDGDWLAHFAEMPNISAFSDTPENALKELETAWEAVKESCRKHGEPVPGLPDTEAYNGRFYVTVDRHLHRALAMEAVREGISLNDLVSGRLAVSVTKPVSYHAAGS